MSDILIESDKLTIGSAIASPTKDFFVKMLTRDIDLQDALLDLLDNCVDGILRTIDNVTGDKPYEGFHATITLSPDYFEIRDNCGGIPKEVAEKYAFSMGRPPAAQISHLAASATVGMYGIGMKRAIFKLGTEALVESRQDQGFVVEFSPTWMADEGWSNLPMYSLPDEKIPERGTTITVYKLNEECKRDFASSDWIDNFRTMISRHYSIIIAKGLKVLVGSPSELESGLEPIIAADFRLLQAAATEDGSSIRPLIYFGTIDGVEVEIYAGLYRRLLTAEEAEREEQTRGATDDAGWTVACNDRVVIWKDKTRLTGWGDSNVPNYHGQFIAITGLVLMRSDDPKKLPLTTTKRGIDAASNVFAEAKDLMRDATKNLTTFTNRWKKHEKQLEDIYRSSEYVDLPRLRKIAQESAMTKVRRSETMKRTDVSLPIPINETTTATVSFIAEKADIAFLARQFFDDQQVKNGEVGEAAFNECLQRYRV